MNVSKALHCASVDSSRNVCLGTIPVQVVGPEGEVWTYAIIDNGSDSTFISNSIASLVGLSGHPSKLSITTVNSTVLRDCREVLLSIQPLVGEEVVFVAQAFTISVLPVSKVRELGNKDLNSWPHLNGVEFSQLEDTSIGILIGCNVPEVHWVLDQRRGKRKQPFAVKTLLGWMLLGPLNGGKANESTVNYTTSRDNELISKVERLFNIELQDQEYISEIEVSFDDRLALSQVKDSIRLAEGHYEIALPWRKYPSCLPNNRCIAENRLNQLKRRFSLHPELFSKYRTIIENYLKKGYIELVQTRNLGKIDEPKWYLPHHPVYNPHKPGKIRIVFDCAAKFQDISLNDILLQGPDLTNRLLGVLIRFRRESVAFAADIEEMFLQVRVPERDRSVLRFLWWPEENMNDAPVEYQMTVHPFGAKSSPFCANFALQQIVIDNIGLFDDRCFDIIKNNFYVDDCLVSVTSTAEAITLVHELRKLLSNAGFRLAKWICNKKCVLDSIPQDELARSNIDLDLQRLHIDKTLGVEWNVDNDTFGFRVHPFNRTPTRRSILSYVSSLFDPLGLVSPIILPARILLQKLCAERLSWDEELSEAYKTMWRSWLNQLCVLQTVTISRCLKPNGFNVKDVELHLFSDASEVGYGCAGYLRFVSNSRNIHCSLVLGKSRVTPLKFITIPRLELQAAVLMVRMYRQIEKELCLTLSSVWLWTDSMLVLQYIQNTSTRFRTFVANRVSTILSHSSITQWHYIKGNLNPADLASRGFNCTETAKLHMWLKGPSFLWENQSSWPNYELKTPSLSALNAEIKPVACRMNMINSYHSMSKFLSHYSDWFALQKAVAWLNRFKMYLLVKSKKSTDVSLNVGFLRVDELTTAKLCILKLVQRESFLTPEDFNLSEERKILPTRLSFLKGLSPIVKDGLIRVGGRLQRAPLNYNSQHPIILPSQHHVTELIIRCIHQIEGHSGATQVLASIRKEYWILKGCATVRKVINKCIPCKERSAVSFEQLMAPLPISRVTPNEPPFTSTGVDFFGPFLVKRGRGSEKRYGCLFTCLRMRAVHIEVAHSLTSDSFISAFCRFVARRGSPRELFSDNATNFKGSETEVREILIMWNNESVRNRLLEHSVEWHFNPPNSSHRGGAWERIIRSIRRILGHLLKENVVSDETLLTALAEVEKILNDRPLLPISEDSKDFDVLTPSMLLLLRNNGCTSVLPDLNINMYVNHWRQAQHLADIFWRRWMNEYLPTLQLRHKWTSPKPNIQLGDLVLVTDQKNARGKWPKGIVEEIYPDDQGLVRRASIRTQSGIICRDVRKLCLLEAVEDQRLSMEISGRFGGRC